MRCFVRLTTVVVLTIAAAACWALQLPGISAEGWGKFDLRPGDRLILSGGSPVLNLTEQKVTLAASRIEVIFVKPVRAGDSEFTPDKILLTGGSPTLTSGQSRVTFRAGRIELVFTKPTGPIGVDKIILTEGSPEIVSEQQGVDLKASEITVSPAKTKGGLPIESALAKGDVRFVQAKGDNKVNSSSDTLEITGGDKAVFTGHVMVDMKNPKRHATLSGAKATITGLQTQPGKPDGQHLVAQGKDGSRAKLDVEGLISSEAETVDVTRQRALLTGKSSKAYLTEQKTILEAADIEIKLAEAQTATSTVERVTLRGGSPKVVSEQQGLTLLAADNQLQKVDGYIEIVPSKAKGRGAIESASARGVVQLVQALGDKKLDATSDSLDISDRGDKAAFAGSVVMNLDYPDYKGKVAGDSVTMTGLQSQEMTNQHLTVESYPSPDNPKVPRNAQITLTGTMEAQAATIDIDAKRAILRGGTPTANLIQKKTNTPPTTTSVEAGVITVNFAQMQTAKGNQIVVQSIDLREGKPKVVSEEQGITLTASQIGVQVPQESNGALQSATATGGVHFVQIQDDRSSDITSDSLDVKDNGDTAVFTGQVTANARTMKDKMQMNGDTATVTGLLAKPGKTAQPHIVVETTSGLSRLHIESKTPPPPVEPKKKAKSKR